MNPQARATLIIHRLCSAGHSLAQLLPKMLPSHQKPKQRALCQELCYGVTRFYYRLTPLANKLLHKPLPKESKLIYVLLLVGLYQLMMMRTPTHAAVDETVKAARDLEKSWAKGLLNACLRTFLRRQNDLIMQLENNNLSFHYAHPNWLIKRFQRDWPDNWRAILLANNQHPPMSLRINQAKINRFDYLQLLAQQHISASAQDQSPVGIMLAKPCNVEMLPGFLPGYVSVQDLGAQLCAPLMQLKPGLRVLDACAAPGGKTCHMLEQHPRLKELVAIDHDVHRLKSINENLIRLGLNAKAVHGDVLKPNSWWDGQSFDRILLDAPCSATGVIRRHPDIKLLRRDSDITNLVRGQDKLLQTLWPLLKVGGLLVYATCSILPEENCQQINTFLQNHKDAKEMRISASWGVGQIVGRQILPGEEHMDGFYYACLEKRSV